MVARNERDGSPLRMWGSVPRSLKEKGGPRQNLGEEPCDTRFRGRGFAVQIAQDYSFLFEKGEGRGKGGAKREK